MVQKSIINKRIRSSINNSIINYLMKSTIAVDVMLGALMLIILVAQTLFFLDKLSAYYSYLFAVKMAQYITMETVHSLNQTEILSVLYNTSIKSYIPVIPRVDVPIYAHITSCVVSLTPMQVENGNPTPAKKVTKVCTKIVTDQGTVEYCDYSIARISGNPKFKCFER